MRGGGAGKIQKLRIEEGDYSVLKSNEENMHKNLSNIQN